MRIKANGEKVVMLTERLPFVKPNELVAVHKATSSWLRQNLPGGSREARRFTNTTAFVSKGKALTRRGEVALIFFGRPGRAYGLTDVNLLRVFAERRRIAKNPADPNVHEFLVADISDKEGVPLGGVYSRGFSSKGQSRVERFGNTKINKGRKGMHFDRTTARGGGVRPKSQDVTTDEGDVNNGI